ncbi:MAG: ATP-dependent zinc protease [Succinivibrionaceae bacterium]|nr:ATP-dependent zinc protease [Succinivibrionaceae bacterium]
MNKNVKHIAKAGAAGSASAKNGKEVSETNDNLPKQQLMQADGKLLLGEYEWVKFPEYDLSAQARIDTGASVSSISAISIEKFEREGKTWYRFQFPCDGHKLLTMEGPFVRTIRTRQASAADIETRPVVKLEIQLGDLTTVSEFSLKDRTKMDFPILIGRTFLIDNAVVDVSKRSIQKRLKAENVGSSKKVEAVAEETDDDVSSGKKQSKKSQPQLKNRPAK